MSYRDKALQIKAVGPVGAGVITQAVEIAAKADAEIAELRAEIERLRKAIQEGAEYHQGYADKYRDYAGHGTSPSQIDNADRARRHQKRADYWRGVLDAK